jgi:hypothetical protein
MGCGPDLGGQDDVGPRLEDLLYPLLRNVRLALSDGVELLGIRDQDLLSPPSKKRKKQKQNFLKSGSSEIKFRAQRGNVDQTLCCGLLAIPRQRIYYYYYLPTPDLDAHLHARLHQVEVQAGNLGILNLLDHRLRASWNGKERKK